MTLNETQKATLPLLAAVGINYIAQVPYYLHQYYYKRHLMPSWPGTALLLFTLLWFIAGYYLYINDKKFGKGLLLSFLSAQVLFYGQAIIYGLINGSGAVAQLRTHSPFLFIIFLIGYVNFAVAAWYIFWIARSFSIKRAG